VRDHQRRHIEDWYWVGCAELSWVRGETDLDRVIVVHDEIDCPHEIEGDDEGPEERTYSYREKRQESQDSGREVTVGGKHSETGGQIGTDDAWNQKDESEEAKAVQRCDRALRTESVHCLEPGEDVDNEAKQPRDVTEDEMQLEDDCGRHSSLLLR